MSRSPTIKQTFAIIRASIAERSKESEYRLLSAIIHLNGCSQQIADNLKLVDELLKLAGEVSAYRGPGYQSATCSIAQLQGYVIMLIVTTLPKDVSYPSFAEARIANPTAADTWDALEKLSAQAQACIERPTSRAKYADRLRQYAWEQLSEVCLHVRDPAWLALALKVAANPGKTSRERMGAISFLSYFWSVEDPDDATIDLLETLAADPPDRDLLMSALVALIEFGLADKMSALIAMEDWDEEHE